MSHPEVLVAVSQKLQEQQEARQQLQFAVRVMDNQAALLNDADTPAFGPENAKVMNTHPDVRYVFKEWPIFADRWENSQAAAERGLSVWKQKGAEAYVTYHSAIYATGHNEGKLLKEDIDQAASKTGWHDAGKENFSVTLDKTDELARSLGLDRHARHYCDAGSNRCYAEKNHGVCRSRTWRKTGNGHQKSIRVAMNSIPKRFH